MSLPNSSTPSSPSSQENRHLPENIVEDQMELSVPLGEAAKILSLWAEKFLENSEEAWHKTAHKDDYIISSYAIMSYCDYDNFPEETISRNNSPTDKVDNFYEFWRRLRIHFREKLNRQLIMPIPEVFLLRHNNDGECETYNDLHIEWVSRIVLCAAVMGCRKQECVSVITSMSNEDQFVLMQLIQAMMDNPRYMVVRTFDEQGSIQSNQNAEATVAILTKYDSLYMNLAKELATKICQSHSMKNDSTASWNREEMLHELMHYQNLMEEQNVELDQCRKNLNTLQKEKDAHKKLMEDHMLACERIVFLEERISETDNLLKEVERMRNLLSEMENSKDVKCECIPMEQIQYEINMLKQKSEQELNQLRVENQKLLSENENLLAEKTLVENEIKRYSSNAIEDTRVVDSEFMHMVMKEVMRINEILVKGIGKIEEGSIM